MTQSDREQLREFTQKLRDEGPAAFADGPWDDAATEGEDKTSARRRKKKRGAMNSSRHARQQTLGDRVLTWLAILALIGLMVGLGGTWLSHQPEAELAGTRTDRLKQTPGLERVESRLTRMEKRLSHILDPYIRTLNNLSVELGDMQKQLNEHIENAGQQQSALPTGIEERLENIEQRLAATDEHMQNVEQQRVATDDDLQDVEQQRVAVAERMQDLEQQLVAANQRMQKLEQQRAIANENTETVEQQRATADQRMQEIEQQLAATDQRMQDLEQQRAIANENTETVEQQRAAADQRMQNLEQQLAATDQRMQNLEQQLVTSNERMKIITQQRTASDEHLENLEQQLATAEGRVETLSGMLAALADNTPANTTGPDQPAPRTMSAAAGPEAATLATQQPVATEPAGTRADTAVEPAGIIPAPAPEAKPEPAAPVAAGTANGNWVINVASYTNERIARRKLAQMQQQGIDVELVTAEVKGKTIYRARVFGFASRRDAESHAVGIRKKLGIEETWITRRE
ncbi:MAG: SPOR domain-containing protein [Gammaproteobacteria bacterium]|nr:MAG: SPOR domain-containing protein [Gammaproteobacteria bacterium]